MKSEKMNKLLVLADNADELAHLLRQRALPDLEISIAQCESAAQTRIGEANIILGKPAFVAPMLAAATRLQWVQSTFAGVDAFCAAGLRTDYCLTGVKGIFGALMSEYVFTYILAIERNLLVTRENQRRRCWQNRPYRSLKGLTIGICGLGSIGQEIARTAAHFQLRVLGLSRSGAKTDFVETVYGPEDICQLARQVDYLVTVLPDTRETRGVINESVFRALGPDSILINVGRGATVDERALEAALRVGDIRAAVLDVFETEPLPQDSPLWDLDNVFITPHNSAMTFPEDIVEIFCENYQRFCDGEVLNGVINFDRAY